MASQATIKTQIESYLNKLPASPQDLNLRIGLTDDLEYNKNELLNSGSLFRRLVLSPAAKITWHHWQTDSEQAAQNILHYFLDQGLQSDIVDKPMLTGTFFYLWYAEPPLAIPEPREFVESLTELTMGEKIKRGISRESRRGAAKYAKSFEVPI